MSRAIRAHKLGHEDEDTLTGQLGIAIHTERWRRVAVSRGQTWAWRISYNRLRGRGMNATEKLTGADGIIRFSISADEQRYTKCALFQAKNVSGGPQQLLPQAIHLSTWNEAAFFIRFQPGGYTAFTVEEGIKQAIGLPHQDEMPLDQFLADVFVACLVGDTDLDYDDAYRVLRWRDNLKQLVHASFAVGHLIDVQVKGPHAARRGLLVPHEEIHQHRMMVSDEEMLGLDDSYDKKTLGRARRASAKLYHDDKHQQLPQGLQDIMLLRMKESNAAADRVLVRLRKRGSQGDEA